MPINESKRSRFQTKQMLLSVCIGAVLSCASAIAYSNSGQQKTFLANVVISAIALPVIPGYISSAYILHNIHNANLVLAGAINFILYTGLSLWFLARRNRKRLIPQSNIER
jgi:hypothetical protein